MSTVLQDAAHAAPEQAGEIHLDVTDLRGGYGESTVLHGVDFTLRRGETLSLLGRNGAGKTSTLRALTGMLSRRSGTAMLKGRNLISLAPHKIARLGLGYVPEERGIFASLSVQENLTLLPMVGTRGMSLDEIHALYPNLAERRNSPGTKLSGGEQQMLAIARVLRTGADLILLDEPTEGLAPVIVQRIAQSLATLKARGITVLLVEQNFDFARRVADRFAVMEHGTIVERFDAHEVDDRRAELNRYLGV